MFGGVVSVALQVAKSEDKDHRGWQDGDNCDQYKQEALKPASMFSKILELRSQVSYSRSAVCHLTERSQDPIPYEGVTSFLRTVDPSTRGPAFGRGSRSGLRPTGVVEGATGLPVRLHTTAQILRTPKMCQTEHPISASTVEERQEACHYKKAPLRRLQAS